MNRRKILMTAGPLIAFVVLLLMLFPVWISNIRPGVSIPRSHLDSLFRLEEIALQKGEYPVGALIAYKDSIIGAGYNTFRDLNHPMGHAEINAIIAVFKSMNYMDFRALDRDSLAIISSYEPCQMCRGVINHLDIRKVRYVRSKPTGIRLKYLSRDLSYHLKLRRISTPDDQ